MRRAPALYIIVLAAFLANTLGLGLPLAQAQEFHLPVPGVMVSLSPPLDPPLLKGIKVHPNNPFRFDFILDKGDESSNSSVKEEATKLIKYFLASLTIPEKDLWVNLSPYEKDRVIPQSFGLTEMGRDLLAEDYMLKQITASLIYPEGETGKKFWKRIYEEAAKKFGTTSIPVNTFNKVWIVPEKAVVYENAKAGTAYVVEAKLKVMLEQDYLALSHNVLRQRGPNTSALGSQIVREIVIPELSREVNEDKNFVRLRQVYNSLILATWYKQKIKDSILEQVYADKNKTVGIRYGSSVIAAKRGVRMNDVEAIYRRYLRAFKKGVYNYIKEDIDPATQQMVPRKYFSGGVNETNLRLLLRTTTIIDPDQLDGANKFEISTDFAMVNKGREAAVLGRGRVGQIDRIMGLAHPSLSGQPFSSFVEWMNNIADAVGGKVLTDDKLRLLAQQLNLNSTDLSKLKRRAVIVAEGSHKFYKDIPNDGKINVYLFRDAFGLYAAEKAAGGNPHAMLVSKNLIRHWGGISAGNIIPYIIKEAKYRLGLDVNSPVPSEKFSDFRKLVFKIYDALIAGQDIGDVNPQSVLLKNTNTRELLRNLTVNLSQYLDSTGIAMDMVMNKGIRFIDTTMEGTLVILMECVVHDMLRNNNFKDIDNKTDSRMFYSSLSQAISALDMADKDFARATEFGEGDSYTYPIVFNGTTDAITHEPKIEMANEIKVRQFVFFMAALKSELLKNRDYAQSADDQKVVFVTPMERSNWHMALGVRLRKLTGIRMPDSRDFAPKRQGGKLILNFDLYYANERISLDFEVEGNAIQKFFIDYEQPSAFRKRNNNTQLFAILLLWLMQDVSPGLTEFHSTLRDVRASSFLESVINVWKKSDVNVADVLKIANVSNPDGKMTGDISINLSLLNLDEIEKTANSDSAQLSVFPKEYTNMNSAKLVQLLSGSGVDVEHDNKALIELLAQLIDGVRSLKLALNKKYYFDTKKYLSCNLYSKDARAIIKKFPFKTVEITRFEFPRFHDADEELMYHTFLTIGAFGHKFILDLTAEQFDKPVETGRPNRYRDLGVVLIPQSAIEEDPEKYWMYSSGTVFEENINAAMIADQFERLEVALRRPAHGKELLDISGPLQAINSDLELIKIFGTNQLDNVDSILESLWGANALDKEGVQHSYRLEWLAGNKLAQSAIEKENGNYVYSADREVMRLEAIEHWKEALKGFEKEEEYMRSSGKLGVKVDGVDYLQTALDRLGHVIKSLRSGIEIAEGKEPAEPTTFKDVLKIIPEGDKTHLVIEDKGNLLSSKIKGNPLSIASVIYNLIKNANEAIEKMNQGRLAKNEEAVAPKFILRLAKKNDELIIELSDNGPGLPAQYLETDTITVRQKVFNLNNTTKKATGGSGLGTTEAWHVLNLLHGKIEAENLPEGGTKFTMHFPIAGDWILDGKISDIKPSIYRYKTVEKIMGLEKKVVIRLEDGRKIFITDDHNHALSFWWLMKKEHRLKESGNKILHIDAHPDAEIPGIYTLSDVKNIFEGSNSLSEVDKLSQGLGIQGFIAPLAQTGFISEWRWLHDLRGGLASALMSKEAALSSYTKNGSDLKDAREFGYDILDIDIDVLNQDYTEDEVQAYLRSFAELAKKAKVVSIAMSPEFIDEAKAIAYIRILVADIVGQDSQGGRDAAMNIPKDPNVRVSKMDREHIEEEKERLKYATIALMYQLPPDSKWRGHWMNASEFPARESVRFPGNDDDGIIHSPYQEDYYLNQLSSREVILGFMLQAITGKFSIDNYEDFLNKAHRMQMIGRDQKTVYIGFNESPDNGKLDEQEKEKTIGDVLNGFHDLKTGFIQKVMPKSFEKFQAYFNLPWDASREDIVRIISDFYFTTMNKPEFPFGSDGVNNSVLMNIVNTMLRLKGLNGINHALNIQGSSDRHEFYNGFLESVNKANPTKDEAMKGLEEKGGIDLTPARMNLQINKEAGTSEGIKFHLDPAMLRQLQNAPGLVPVIISVKPLANLRGFLGIVNQA